MSVIGRLLRPVLRATPLVGFIPAAVLAVVMAVVAGQQPAGPESRFLPTRLGILAVVLAVGFVFDDPAAPLTDPLPSPLRWRRLIRATAAVLIAAGLFAVALPFAADGMRLAAYVDTNVVVPVEPEDATRLQVPVFPWGRLAIEMATMVGFVLAAAAAVARRGENQPGRLATGVFLGVYAVTWMIPESHLPWAFPGDRRWDTGADWWWVALVAVWLVALVLSWDSRVGRSSGLGRRARSEPVAGSVVDSV